VSSKVVEQPQDVVAGGGWLLFRMYYGPEFVSDALERWARQHGVELAFIQPGRPMQNGIVERFNRTYREEVLDCYVFETLGEVRRMTADWIVRYNEQRPHEALGNLSPRQYLMAQSTQPSTSDRSK
jgi:putative transposase